MNATIFVLASMGFLGFLLACLSVTLVVLAWLFDWTGERRALRRERAIDRAVMQKLLRLAAHLPQRNRTPDLVQRDRMYRDNDTADQFATVPLNPPMPCAPEPPPAMDEFASEWSDDEQFVLDLHHGAEFMDLDKRATGDER